MRYESNKIGGMSVYPRKHAAIRDSNEFHLQIPHGETVATQVLNLCWEFSSSSNSSIAIQERRIGPVSLLMCSQGRSRVHKEPLEIGLEGGCFCAFLVKQGHIVCDPGKGSGMVGPGDIFMWQAEHSMSVEIVEPSDCFGLMLPMGRVNSTFLPSTGDLTSYLKGDARLGSLLRAYWGALSNNFLLLDGQQAEAASEIAVDLLGAAIESCNAPSDSQAELFQDIVAFIEHRLKDPELTPSQIATAYGMSLRHLQRLFARQGHSVAGWIRQRRMARSSADLQKPISVTEVAFRWGFNDAAHFTRTFKEHYGVSPREFRKRIPRAVFPNFVT